MKGQIIKEGSIFSGKQMIEIINMHSGCMVRVDGSWPEPAEPQDLSDIAQLDGIHASINYAHEVQFHWEGDGQRVLITMESLKGRCEPVRAGGHAVWHAVV